MTDTPEAVRLADSMLECVDDSPWLTCNVAKMDVKAAAALLRRIPELVAAIAEQHVENAEMFGRVFQLGYEVGQLEAERDQLRAELEKVRWQPIETAPKWQSVLLWATRTGGRCVIDYWGDYDRHNHPRITHWMPLPAAPTPPNADQKGQ